MMTIGNVLDSKAAGHRLNGTSDLENLLSPQELASSMEYKAWEAFEAGRESESQDLVRQLLQLERATQAHARTSEAVDLLTVERRIRGVLVAAGKVTALNKFKVAEAITDFLWENMPVPD
jgi:hypothetical protein